MERFACPDHGRLVVQLSLGRLDDSEALRAEDLTASCVHCSGWWRQTFGAASALEIDDAVAEGLAAFRTPRRTVHRWWLAAAAAATVTLGVGTVWWQQQVPPASTETVVLHQTSEDTVLSRWTFEEGAVEIAEVVVAPAPPTRAMARPEPVADPAPVLQGGFESGDLSGWSSHT